MSLLDWLSDGLGLGGGPTGGNPMQPGPGGQMGDVDPMGAPTGQSMPLPTPAPAPTQPMPPPQMTGTDVPYPPGEDSMSAGGAPPNGPGLPFAPGGDPMTAGGQTPNGPGLPPGAPPPAATAPPGPPTNLVPPGADVPGAMASYTKAGGNLMMPPPGDLPGSPLGQGGGTAKGILESALGLSPERATRVRGNLGAGLKSVAENSGKPGLAAFAGSMGAGIEGGTKSDEKQTDQRTKLLNQMITAQANGDRASYTKALTQYTQAKLEAEKTKAANPEAAAKSRAAMTDEQKLFKVNDTLAKDPQIVAARHGLEAAQRSGSPKDVTAAQKVFDDLFNKKKTDLTASLRAGSQQNPYKVTSQADLEKTAQPGDVYINPADGKPYVFKGKKSAGTSAEAPAAAPAKTDAASAMTPAAAAGLPSPKAAANPEDDDE